MNNKKLQATYRKMDQKIFGHKFGRLTPIKRLNFDGGYSRYLCKCDCGKEVEALGSHLLMGWVVSCGCYHDEGYKDFDKIQHLGTEKLQSKRVEGTSLYAMQMKTPVTNTSGVKGVSYMKDKGKYRAYIHFKGKPIHLGVFDTIEEAAEARKKGEEKYFHPILKKYEDKK